MTLICKYHADYVLYRDWNLGSSSSEMEEIDCRTICSEYEGHISRSEIDHENGGYQVQDRF